MRQGLRRWFATGSPMLWLVAALLATTLAPAPATAKTPGGLHCYGKTCHRVSTLDEMDNIVGRTGLLKASFYDDCRSDRFNACGLTSSGAAFRPDLADNAASPIFPDGTVLLAYNPENKRAAVLRVNSAGPYWGDRKLDVSRAAAEKLGFRRKGVAELMVAIIKSPEPQEARYKKMRQYDRVAGYIGAFTSFHAAHAAALASLELDIETMPSKQANAAGGEPAARNTLKVDKRELFEHAIMYFDPVAPAGLSPAQPHFESVVPSQALEHSRSQMETVTAARSETVPRIEVTAVEPDYSWQGLKQRFAVFLVSALHQARAAAPPPSLPPPQLWPEKLVRFVWRARQQAREGLSHRGVFADLFAQLQLKAQARRYR